jgi:hypothetical protein
MDNKEMNYSTKYGGTWLFIRLFLIVSISVLSLDLLF